MAYQPIVNPEPFIGKSSDTKPTDNIPYGSTFYEDDTGDVYIYGSTGWVVM